MVRHIALIGALAACCWMVDPRPCFAAREAKEKGGEPASEVDVEARRLFDKAQELLQAEETERAVKMLESVIEQYPKSRMRFCAALALGKHYMDVHEQVKAISYLNQLRALDQPDKELSPADKDMLLESMYLTGVANFQARQYGAAFPILRKITTQYPNSVWANQAYYYIGMCHFAQQNWNKTIEALSLVGTFVDPSSPSVQYVEAGRRFYIKIQDADLPVLQNLGKKVFVTMETTHGDKEKTECIPLTAEADVFIGSIPTEIGATKTGDNILQVIGGDVVTTRYEDENSQDGKANVSRESKVKIVSTASLTFTLGDTETKAAAAFLDQPLFVVLQDTDLDLSDKADVAEVKVVSRYKEQEPEDTGDGKGGKGIDIERLLHDGETKFKIRDEVLLKLSETGNPAFHTGRFVGKLAISPVNPDVPLDKTDAILTAALDDEIVATFADELNINGEVRRDVETKLAVIGEIDNQPKASQDVVFDTVVKSKKNLVEGQAYLELARIFKSMGLTKGAKEKAKEGLDRADFIIRTRTPIPSTLKQDAFKLKWELHIVADDLPSAIATCNLFNQLYPDSPFVDQALMGIGAIRMENKQYTEASSVFQQVLRLPKSEAKAEAQFRIAEITELTTKPGSEQAVQQYKACAERYPESEFAGASLAKLVDYHVDTKDFTQANALLEQIFQDYPDAKFLDGMLLKWVLVAYRSGDYQKASDKCSQLVFEYPESPYAEKAKQIMPKIEGQLKKGSEKGKE
jgi:outer membrane protein assembly factor BamD (BamD/ComL family)